MDKKYLSVANIFISQITQVFLVVNHITLLLKKVKTKYSYKLCPFKVYPYNPLKKSIEQFAKQKGFVSSCEK